MLNLLSIFAVLLFILVACGDEEAADQAPEPEQEVINESSEQLEVMVTMFAQYDFARQIGGDHVHVQRLVAPGVDIHTFDPLPQDIMAINESDLFIYTGHEMEPWVHRILDSLDTDELTVLDVSTGVQFLPWYGSHDHSHDHDHHHHDHDDEEEHDHDHHHHDHEDEEEHDHDHHHHDDEDHSHGHDHDHDHDYDPHIWTSPLNAIVMVRNIQAYLTTLMPEYAQYFETNAAILIEELTELDHDFRHMMSHAHRTTIYHGGRFALHYLMYEYGIHFVAAAMETDPADNPVLLAQLITEINDYEIPAIFHEELINPYTANMIAEETGAQLLLLHTIHNVSNEEIEAGETYVSLMRQNLENLRIALN